MQFQIEETFSWISSRDVRSVKELSRTILACDLWNIETDLAPELISLKREGCWEESLRDTARAASTLASRNVIYPEVVEWLLSKQKDGASWNNDVYDTAYVLSSLADMGVHDRKACLWLVENYGPAWEHPGTTALIISALTKQEKLNKIENTDIKEFISERAEWILSKRTYKGAWKTIATSNIVMQALILAGYDNELEEPIHWLLDRMNFNGSWGKNEGDINTTALTLITLASLEKIGF
ncbi:prenyltransferase/squalene oxidase repeat-containing protein [Methanolobus sp. ZRKC2]|uniref:prenyltransferase/squalene oxidase repeat-containing protein n=1 Tax=Methanolobus sp. ZRKC2 TaxID=3125783 RepID=UPI00324DCE89